MHGRLEPEGLEGWGRFKLPVPPPFSLPDGEIFRGRRWCLGWLCSQGAGPANFLNFPGAAEGSGMAGSTECRGWGWGGGVGGGRGKGGRLCSAAEPAGCGGKAVKVPARGGTPLSYR